MEYERIRKVQMGVMSPTKLRTKLLGSHGKTKKEDATKSPSRLHDDDDHPKNSLLAQELDEEYPKDRSDSSRSRSDASHGRAAHIGSGNGYDSGHESGNAAAGGNFEFHREERAAAQPHPVVGPFFRQVPSKWNDAEKWIAGRHVVHSNPIFSRKAALHSPSGGALVAPESVLSSEMRSGCSSDNLLSSRGAVGSALTELLSSPSSVSGPANKHSHHKKLRVSERLPSETSTVSPLVQSVSMRDVGTEMTPIASQEQSRSGTPVGATTPSLSPLCSVPSSPKDGQSASSSASERELQIRTRCEIAALGLQLGKMNIASWACKEDLVQASPDMNPDPDEDDEDEAKKEEFEARALAWEESRKCKLASRYQRKEVKIQEWESRRKSKFEAKMLNAEVQAEQMKARAKSNLTKRLSILSHKVEGKQERIEARRNRQATRLARQVEGVRKTGRLPSRFRCCSWFL